MKRRRFKLKQALTVWEIQGLPSPGWSPQITHIRIYEDSVGTQLFMEGTDTSTAGTITDWESILAAIPLGAVYVACEKPL